MKQWSVLILVFFFKASYGQVQYSLPAAIYDEETTPHLLSKKLTASLRTESQKVSAIFHWITDNISYNTGIFFKIPRKAPILYPPLSVDDSGPLPTLNDFVAENVLRRRVAVCEGYARLFASLCTHAGIQAEVVNGYVPNGGGPVGKFRTNHTWNAVRIDSTWHLLDATWASGYVTYSNDFVRTYNPRFYLTRPAEFFQDHYPEDLRWTLLAEPPLLKEYKAAPFRYQGFLKSRIQSFSPLSGMLEGQVGDTLSICIAPGDKSKKLLLTTTAPTDSLLEAWEKIPDSASTRSDKTKCGQYIIREGDGAWLYVIYDHVPILRYRLRVKGEEPSAADHQLH